MTSIEELRKLSNELINNPDKVYELTPEQVVEMNKFIDPYGTVVGGKKSWINVSIMNWREEYLKKLHTTALIGYTYRLASEYTPEAELAALNAKHNAEIKTLNEKEASTIAHRNSLATEDPAYMQKHADDSDTIDCIHDKRAALTKEHNQAVKLYTDTARKLVKQFLDRHFNYDPDRHIRGSHSSNADDPERLTLEQLRAKLSNPVPVATHADPADKLLFTYQITRRAHETLKATLQVLADPAALSDQEAILSRKYMQLGKLLEEMNEAAEIAGAEIRTNALHDPPTDVFYHYNRYLTNHYEQIREVVSALYNEKPDIESAIIYYDKFKSEDAARDHRVKHAEEFRSEVLTISNNGITLLGPFKENRARVDFYNKNTEILKRMTEQMEADHKLGKDLMEKRVKEKKIKNINEMGPDAPGLKEYSNSVNTVAELGAKKMLTREEQDRYSRAINHKDAVEGVGDAIEIDMFFPRELDGEMKLEKTKFYSQAESPLHLQEGSEYAAAYQPKRGPNERISYNTRTITGRNGEKKEIKTLRKRAPTDSNQH